MRFSTPIVFLSYFYSVFGLHLQHGRNFSSNTSAIVGGTVTYIHQYPSTVSLRVIFPANERDCGGSIISPQFVLSAAHCFDLTFQFIRLSVGSRIWDDGQIYFSNDFRPHPSYDRKFLEFDIALVKPERDIDFNNVTVKPVRLPKYKQRLMMRSVIVTVGWGYTSENGKDTSEYLRAVKLPVRSLTNCQKRYKGLTEITVRMFCAGYRYWSGGICKLLGTLEAAATGLHHARNMLARRFSGCFKQAKITLFRKASFVKRIGEYENNIGDSGSPAFDKWGMQVGIVVASKGCGRAGYPSIYTDVAIFRNWIRLVTDV